MRNKYAMVFPGQGSQKIGMLRELASNYSLIEKTFNEASAALDYDLWDLVQNGPEDKLNRTEFAQPALLAAGVAVWRIWCSKNKSMPSFLAGHSLGEYTALVSGSALDFKTAIGLVRDRGRFMQNAYSGNGAMVAIVGLDNMTISKICDDARCNDVLVVSNYNSLDQLVLSGTLSAVERAVEIAKKLHAKIVKILPISIPSHCVLMKPAALKLAKLLQQTIINVPKIPIIHNANVIFYDDPQKIRNILVEQLSSPVRWVETIQFMVTNGVKCVLECGPGNVLTGLNKRIDDKLIVDFIGESLKIDNKLPLCV
ncbi:MAG: ACP S-malonyltransferase [Coxiellaceae bacterium]|jgi:[acyl-carrier-protein] S-malonyltransferase|nr:ACP S-malonyltransferase [Coxiellaceae bacterium]